MSDAHLANVESFLSHGHQRRAVAAGHAGTNSSHGQAPGEALPGFAGELCVMASSDVTVADI